MTTATLPHVPTCPAAAYEEYRGVVFSQVHKFFARYGGDFEELVGIANLAFVKGHNQWHRGTRPNGAEITHAYHIEIRRWVWFDLVDEMRVRATRANRGAVRAVGDVVYTFADTTFDAATLAHDLTADARVVLGLVLDPPPTVAATARAKGGEPRNVRSTVRTWLRGAGWTAARINETFEEIREALG